MTHLGDARTDRYPVGKGHYGKDRDYAPITWTNNPDIQRAGSVPIDDPVEQSLLKKRQADAGRLYQEGRNISLTAEDFNKKTQAYFDAYQKMYEALRLDFPGMSSEEKQLKRQEALETWGIQLGGGRSTGVQNLIAKVLDGTKRDDAGTFPALGGDEDTAPGKSLADTPIRDLTPSQYNDLVASGQFQFGKQPDVVKTWPSYPEAERAAKSAGELNYTIQPVDKKDAEGNPVREYTWMPITDPSQIRAQASLRGKYRFEYVPGSEGMGQKMFHVIDRNGIVIETVKVPERLTERDINVIEEPFENDPNKMHVTVLAGGKVQETFTYDIEKPVVLYDTYATAMDAGLNTQGIPSSRIEVKSSVIDGKLQYYPTVGAMKYRPGIVTERELGGTGDRTFFRTEDGDFSELERTFEPGVYRDPASGRQYQQNPDGSIKVLGREYQPGLVQTGPYTALQQPTGQLTEVARRFEPGFITDAQGRELIQQPTGAVSQPRPVNMEEIITQALVDGDWDKALAFEDFKNRPTAMEAFQAALNFARSPADQQLISSIARGEVTVEPPPAGTIRRVGPQPDFLVEEYNTFQQRLRGGRPPTPAEQARYTQRHLEGRSPQYDQLELTLQQRDHELAQAREAAEALAGSYNEQLKALETEMEKAFQASFTPLGQELGVETPQWESVLAGLMADQTAKTTQTGETSDTTYQGARSYTQAREQMDALVASGQYTQQKANEHLASMLASGYVSPITEEESALYNVTMQDYVVGGKYGATKEVQKPSYGWNLEQARDYISKYHPDVSIPGLSAEEIRLASMGSAADWTQLTKIAESKSKFLPPGQEIDTSEVDKATGLFLKPLEVEAPAKTPVKTPVETPVETAKVGTTVTTEGEYPFMDYEDPNDIPAPTRGKASDAINQIRDYGNKILRMQEQITQNREARDALAAAKQAQEAQQLSSFFAGAFRPAVNRQDRDDSNIASSKVEHPFMDYEDPAPTSAITENLTARRNFAKAQRLADVVEYPFMDYEDPNDIPAPIARPAPSPSVSPTSYSIFDDHGPSDDYLFGSFAHGGMARGNQFEIVGEEGPELVDLPPGSFVLPLKNLNRKEMVALQQKGVPGYAGGGVVFGSQTLPLGIRQLQAGRQITPSRGYLSQQAGLTIPSVQAFQNLTPESRDIFRDIAMQAGIPARSFEQELALARPSGARLPLARTLPVTRRGIR